MINFGRDYPNQIRRPLGLLRPGDPAAADQRLTMIQGKIISIAGTIRLREGKPEIDRLGTQRLEFSDGTVSRQRHRTPPPTIPSANKRRATYLSGLKEFFDRS